MEGSDTQGLFECINRGRCVLSPIASRPRAATLILVAWLVSPVRFSINVKTEELPTTPGLVTEAILRPLLQAQKKRNS
jgi:hypothetical protein